MTLTTSSIAMRLLPLLLFLSPIFAQIIGRVSPATDLLEYKIDCSILVYGAVADNSTDIANALEASFSDCIHHHAESKLVVPEGENLINRGVVLSNATNWAFQLDGLITPAYGVNWAIKRGLLLQGYAGVDVLNGTINGECDQ